MSLIPTHSAPLAASEAGKAQGVPRTPSRKRTASHLDDAAAAYCAGVHLYPAVNCSTGEWSQRPVNQLPRSTVNADPAQLHRLFGDGTSRPGGGQGTLRYRLPSINSEPIVHPPSVRELFIQEVADQRRRRHVQARDTAQPSSSRQSSPSPKEKQKWVSRWVSLTDGMDRRCDLCLLASRLYIDARGRALLQPYCGPRPVNGDLDCLHSAKSPPSTARSHDEDAYQADEESAGSVTPIKPLDPAQPKQFTVFNLHHDAHDRRYVIVRLESWDDVMSRSREAIRSNSPTSGPNNEETEGSSSVPTHSSATTVRRGLEGPLWHWINVYDQHPALDLFEANVQLVATYPKELRVAQWQRRTWQYTVAPPDHPRPMMSVDMTQGLQEKVENPISSSLSTNVEQPHEEHLEMANPWPRQMGFSAPSSPNFRSLSPYSSSNPCEYVYLPWTPPRPQRAPLFAAPAPSIAPPPAPAPAPSTAPLASTAGWTWHASVGWSWQGRFPQGTRVALSNQFGGAERLGRPAQLNDPFFTDYRVWNVHPDAVEGGEDLSVVGSSNDSLGSSSTATVTEEESHAIDVDVSEWSSSLSSSYSIDNVD